MAIGRVEVLSDNLAAWGVQVLDYEYDGKSVDFQNLMIKITEKRATTVETEIKPMSTRMSKRNTNLGYLGDALAAVSDLSAKFDSDNSGDDTDSVSNLPPSALSGFRLILDGRMKEAADGGHPQFWGYVDAEGNNRGALRLSKSEAEYYMQVLKTKIDGLNNAASKDMTRLQSLVDKRDESYSTASTLMQAIGDTRANTIKNM